MANCTDANFATYLSPAIDPTQFHDWFDEIGSLSLDPAVPALFDQITVWGKRKAERFRIVHDRSKPILASNVLFHSFMAEVEEEIETIGYDRRQFHFPLKATALDDGDSRLVPQLQVADLCAGCINHFMKCREAAQQDRLSEGIAAAGCLEWFVNALLPSAEVTPDELGTRQGGGVNPVDPMVQRAARARSSSR